MKADRPRLGSFLSFFFLGFLPLLLPPSPSAGSAEEALGFDFAFFFSGFASLESPVGVGEGLCLAFFCYNKA